MQKVAVVTGASKGLGKEIARILFEKGHNVVICARNRKEVEMAAQEINVVPFVADVVKEEEVKRLADFTVSKFGQIDIWINNAGVWLPHAPIEQLDIDRVRKMFEPNVFGVMSGSKVALIQMRQQGRGIIVNIISNSALMGRPLSSGYAASKWAARGFTDSLRAECTGSDIQVVGVYPGGIQTEFFEGNRPEKFKEYMSAESVARKIIENLEQSSPEVDLIIQRPGK